MQLLLSGLFALGRIQLAAFIFLSNKQNNMYLLSRSNATWLFICGFRSPCPQIILGLCISREAFNNNICSKKLKYLCLLWHSVTNKGICLFVTRSCLTLLYPLYLSLKVQSQLSCVKDTVEETSIYLSVNYIYS